MGAPVVQYNTWSRRENFAHKGMAKYTTFHTVIFNYDF
jgi:hypothetical protein